jgi:hypothetical protein
MRVAGPVEKTGRGRPDRLRVLSRVPAVSRSRVDDLQQGVSHARVVGDARKQVGFEGASGCPHRLSRRRAADHVTTTVVRVLLARDVALTLEALKGSGHRLHFHPGGLRELGLAELPRAEHMEHDQARVGKAELFESLDPRVFDEAGRGRQQPTRGPAIHPGCIRHLLATSLITS